LNYFPEQDWRAEDGSSSLVEGATHVAYPRTRRETGELKGVCWARDAGKFSWKKKGARDEARRDENRDQLRPITI